ncbi:hypothetical protein PACTADRAFT_4679 [Pachysolen tannophilus NRRL Y-2460]|uniref:TLDc domain-containing protein n=1 Tax=Pachysolen tannophilus NRRL Y-2460 TaxID=669874 RepID=A0A1E4TPV9_PACTA|nr:hypothetical protein PACTADRAFT_4679 [Pachysolen tannophilus NRRL Y-2460]
MGQALSSDGENGGSYVDGQSQKKIIKLTLTDLNNLFLKKSLSTLQQIEIYSIKANLRISDLNDDKLINNCEEFKKLVSLEGLIENDEEISEILFKFIINLGSFPILDGHCKNNGIDSIMLIKAINLLDRSRFNAIFNKEFEYVKLLLVCFCLPYNHDKEKLFIHSSSNDVYDATLINNKLSWSSIDYYSSLDIDNLIIPASVLLKIFTFCLCATRLSLDQFKFFRLNKFKSEFENWSKYKKIAYCLMKTIEYNINSTNIDNYDLSITRVNYCIATTFANIFQPFTALLSPLLFMEHSVSPPLCETLVPKIEIEMTRLVNEFTLSQLATFLPANLCYTNMKKLYVGKDSGFSMRSFESKVFGWKAPTILLVSGHRIEPNKKKISKRCDTFINEEYPKFRRSPENPSKIYGEGSERLTYGVYLHHAWKISNKEPFGDSKTLIFQLAPQQQLFESSLFQNSYAYFNTLNNGGIGFGCNLPEIKNGIKKYHPGNVSLLIDGGLEFCCFRHIGIGGSFNTGSGFNKLPSESVPHSANSITPEYEDKFTISDIEVFGVGSDKEIQEQIKSWEWEKREAEARQRVNIKNLGEERAFLEMVGLAGNHGGTGGSV